MFDFSSLPPSPPSAQPLANVVLSQQQRLALLQLWLVPGIGLASLQRLLPIVLAGFELSQGLSRLERGCGLSSKQLLALAAAKASTQLFNDAAAHLEWSEQAGQHCLFWCEPNYPQLLRETAQPPPVMLCKGQLESLSKHCLAMVGSRSASPPAKAIATDLAQFLVQRGFTIVSGGAKGIDAASHQGALLKQGATVAVLGHGFEHCYPREHRALFERIQEQGALISEFPLETTPRSEFFPRRNRVVTGLSLGVIVVEAAVQSGSLISARLAMEQNREVFAVPGSIHNPKARGCHALIKQGAKLVESGDDILEELQWGNALEITTQANNQDPELLPALSAVQHEIVVNLQSQPLTLNQLGDCLPQLSPAQLASALSLLEIEGLVASDTTNGSFYYLGIHSGS